MIFYKKLFQTIYLKYYNICYKILLFFKNKKFLHLFKYFKCFQINKFIVLLDLNFYIKIIKINLSMIFIINLIYKKNNNKYQYLKRK
jgi:hypothetical protein